MIKVTLTKFKKHLPKLDFWVVSILLASILVLIINITAIQTTRPFNSDDVVTQTMIHDHRTTGGHGVLWFGEDNFIIKMPFYMLTDFLFTNSRSVIFATVIIFDVAGLILFYLAALYFLKRFKVRKQTSLLAMVWLMSSYNIAWYFLMNPNLRNVEIGINFAILALLAKYIDGDFKFDSYIKKALACVLMGLLGLFFYSDPFFTFMLGIPLLLFLAWHFIWQKPDRRRILYAFCFVAASIVISFIWAKFFTHFFNFSLKKASTSLASLSDMGQSAQQFGWNYFYIYFADFWNKPFLSYTYFRGLVNAQLVASSLVVPIIILSRKLRKTDPWLIFILAMPLFIGGIFIASQNTVASGFPSVRFLVLMPFYTIFAIILFFEQITNSLVKKLLLGILACATILNVGSLTRDIFVHTSTSPNNANLEIIDALRENNISKGYAHSWDSSINAYLSDNRLRILRVECFTKIYWLMADGNERITASQTFYIYDSKYFQKCSQNQVHERLGNPIKIIPINDEITLFLYDYDIGSRFDVFIPK